MLCAWLRPLKKSTSACSNCFFLFGLLELLNILGDPRLLARALSWVGGGGVNTRTVPDVNKRKGRGGNVCLPLKGCGSCKASQKVSSGHLGSLFFNLILSVAVLVLFDWL